MIYFIRRASSFYYGLEIQFYSSENAITLEKRRKGRSNRKLTLINFYTIGTRKTASFPSRQWKFLFFFHLFLQRGKLGANKLFSSATQSFLLSI